MCSAILLATLTSGQGKPEGSALPISVTKYHSIFLAEVEDARESGWDSQVPQQRTVAVRLHVTRIVKNEDHQDLAAGEYAAKLMQARWPAGRIGDNPYFWSDKDVHAGQQYLVFSNLKKKGLPAMFESPDLAEPVSASDDAVGDVELILNTSSMSLSRQGQVVADALQRSTKPRTRFIAEYSAAILAAGTDSDTEALADALKNLKVSSFSQEARSYLLWQLFQLSRTLDHPSANLLQVFVTLAARYFTSGAEEADRTLTPLQVEILQNYVPWISKSDRASAILRKESSLPMMQEVRRKTALIAADSRLATEQRAEVRQLLTLISGQ